MKYSNEEKTAIIYEHPKRGMILITIDNKEEFELIKKNNVIEDYKPLVEDIND